MQGTRTIRIALALVATLGVVGTLAAGCGGRISRRWIAARDHRFSRWQGGQGGSTTMIDSLEGGTASSWTPFMTGGSSISSASAPLHADGASTSTEITYSVVTGGSAGLERDFSTPQDWSTELGLDPLGLRPGHRTLVPGSGLRRRERALGVTLPGRLQRLEADLDSVQRHDGRQLAAADRARRWCARLLPA